MADPAAVPFRFDLDFGGAPPRPEPTPDDGARRAALEEAYARGEAAGRSAAATSVTAELNAAVVRLGAQLAAAENTAAARAFARDEATLQLAMAIAGKLAGAALERFPLAAIERLAAACFADARGAPHVVVRVNDGLVDEIKTRLQAVAAERGFAGKLVVLGEPDIPRGDGRLEWADGGMVHDHAALADAVSRALTDYLSDNADPPA